MGDVGETFRALKERKKEQKAKRLQSANPEGWEKHTDYHWHRTINGKKINYWPSSGLCMIENKRYNINSKYIRNLLHGVMGGSDD